ncbi:ATP-binding cassette domain-containing protein, partial [Klebsiella pneumoniae]|uniref:ATP-binding cassette domain-containing protein n=1 Tax=Klebsiella pneumoniae TaxID=573 RepID=UPI0034DAE34F
PTQGSVEVGGQELTALSEKELTNARRQIGMIFQDHHLLMDRTVFDNVAIPLIIAGASYDDIRRRVSAALD